jgi:hypothetical protein
MKKLITATVLTVAALTSVEGRAVEFKLYYSANERAAIRQMPITERPFRPIHVYGNTVRLLNRIGVPVAP